MRSTLWIVIALVMTTTGVAFAQDGLLNDQGTSWINGLIIVGLSLVAAIAVSKAVYDTFLKPKILSDAQKVVDKASATTADAIAKLQASVDAMSAKISDLEEADRNHMLAQVSTWGTDEHGLLKDLKVLINSKSVDRLSALERSFDEVRLAVSNNGAMSAEQYSDILVQLKQVQSVVSDVADAVSSRRKE